MNKPLSTYERKMQDPKFKKAYKKSYQELLFSELLIAVMGEDKKSVRKLAKETDLSPSIIQGLRSGKQQDMRVSNFINISNALGYEIILKKGKEQLVLYDKIQGLENHIGLKAVA